MNITKKTACCAALMLLLIFNGCNNPDPGPDPPDPRPALTIYGIYEGSQESAANGSAGADPSTARGGAEVQAYALADNGSQTPVAGGPTQAPTDENGGFVITLYTAVKNLIIKITKDADEEKCVLTNAGKGQQAEQDGRRLRRLFAHAGDNSTDNLTEYALVNPETDVEADVVLSEVLRDGTPPSEVNAQDIDEMIAPDIAQDIRGDITVRDCVISLLQEGRTDAKNLFIAVLEDRNLNQQSIENAGEIIRDALARIETLRGQTRKKIYELKATGDNNTEAQIETLRSQQRQQVLEIFKDEGIPPQLHMKASIISQSAFERFIFKIGPTCDASKLSLGNRLIRRVLIRRVQGDAMQTISILKNTFDYDNTTAINAACASFQSTLMAADPNLDAGPAQGTAMKAFYTLMTEKILAAVDNRLVPDQAIMRVLEFMKTSRPQLTQDLQAAQDISAIKKAYEDYFSRIRSSIMQNIPLAPGDTQEAGMKKRVLIDLLLSIGTQ